MAHKPSTFLIYIVLVTLILSTAQKTEQQTTAHFKAWKIPSYMRENLQWMLNDFNRRFEEKLEHYKTELKSRFEEFKDMPDDVVLDLEAGILIKRSDFIKLQEQKKKKEIKKNEKTT